MPRILYIITDLDVGGVPLHLLRLATGVRDAGWSVGVVSLADVGPVGRRLQHAGIDVFACAAAGPADWRVFERLAGQLRDFAPDLVHSFLFHANVASRVAAVLSGIPARRLICEIQTVEIERTWHLWVDRLTFPLCAMTIGNSVSVVEHLHRKAGIPRDRLRLVAGGIDVEAVEGADPLPRVSLGVTDATPLLLWVGRMDPIKGLDTLIDAAAILAREMDFQLLLAGDGPERPRVESAIARHRLFGHVTLLGRRDDVPRLLRTADLFVFPSRTEGLPNALLEALAAGVPVVVTDVPGCHDVVTGGVTGRLVPPNNPLGLAKAMLQALVDRQASTAMAAAARAYVRREHTLSRCLARYLEVYRDVRDRG